MNVAEVFETAAQIERNGRDFYMKAASTASKPEAKTLLEKLAKMENEHEKLFIEMKSIFVGDGESAMPDLDGQAMSYIKAMAEGKIFGKDTPASLIRSGSGMNEIFSIAIAIEKDSVVYYSAIKKLLAQSSEKEKIDILINEELGHIAVISREMAAAAAS